MPRVTEGMTVSPRFGLREGKRGVVTHVQSRGKGGKYSRVSVRFEGARSSTTRWYSMNSLEIVDESSG